MNYTTRNQIATHDPSGSASRTGEDTLRLIAHLPAPEGLEVRVKAGLRAAPRTARILDWPVALRPGSDWVRSAAAAAIVFVVVGGGWGVYSRVQQPQPARVIVMPPRVAAPGGFSSGGAMRTPNTLNGPVVTHPVTAKPAQGKAPAQKPQTPNHRERAADPQAPKPSALPAK